MTFAVGAKLFPKVDQGNGMPPLAMAIEKAYMECGEKGATGGTYSPASDSVSGRLSPLERTALKEKYGAQYVCGSPYGRI